MYSVYWIHLKNHKDVYLQGYVGKAKDIERRWARHRSHSVENTKIINKRPLYQAIRRHGLQNFVFEVVAKELDQESAFNLEYALRPCYRVGYNVGPGGNYLSVTKCCSLSELRFKPNGKKGIAMYQGRVRKYYQENA